MLTNSENRERKYHFWGWGLFLVCACFFIAAGIKSGDALYLIGSIIFFVACIFFIVPLTIKKNESGDSKKK